MHDLLRPLPSPPTPPPGFQPRVTTPGFMLTGAVSRSHYHQGEELDSARAVLLNAWSDNATWLVLSRSRLYAVLLNVRSAEVLLGTPRRSVLTEFGLGLHFELKRHGSTRFLRLSPDTQPLVPMDELRSEASIRRALSDLVTDQARAQRASLQAMKHTDYATH